ncbi:MAG: hypothetical protein AAF921_09745 [Cyanobacteria bacterium P01_D01_bin.44]
MAHWTPQYRIALMGGMLSYGAQLLIRQDAEAHTNHDHTKRDDQADPAAAGEQPTSASDASAIEEPAVSPNKADSDALPSSDVQMEAPAETAIQEVPATQASPSTAASQALFLDGFSIGLGESLLGLMIAGPLLLRSLRKWLQS